MSAVQRIRRTVEVSRIHVNSELDGGGSQGDCQNKWAFPCRGDAPRIGSDLVTFDPQGERRREGSWEVRLPLEGIWSK